MLSFFEFCRILHFTSYIITHSIWVRATDLAMSPDDRSKQLPGAASTIQSDHPENLDKPETSKCRCGDRLTTVADTEQHQADDDDDHVCVSHHTTRSRVYRHFKENANAIEKIAWRILKYQRIVWCKPYFDILKRFGVDHQRDRQTNRRNCYSILQRALKIWEWHKRRIREHGTMYGKNG